MRVFLKRSGRADEHRAGAVLEAFGGSGVVRLIGKRPDELQLELLEPATPLSTLVEKDDQAATVILAEAIGALAPRHVPAGTPTVTDWGLSFDRYLESRAEQIPHDLVRCAQEVYSQLCASQRQVRLLHGDLHHDNVLFDASRGWVAIDPKGVVGELEYEVGAALRNPIDLPHVFTDPAAIDARIRILSEMLNLDSVRVTSWAFAQAVLAAIWMVEDGEPVTDRHPWIALAQALRERLPPAPL
jgi:streptomycin 6-kinase